VYDGSESADAVPLVTWALPLSRPLRLLNRGIVFTSTIPLPPTVSALNHGDCPDGWRSALLSRFEGWICRRLFAPDHSCLRSDKRHRHFLTLQATPALTRCGYRCSLERRPNSRTTQMGRIEISTRQQRWLSVSRQKIKGNGFPRIAAVPGRVVTRTSELACRSMAPFSL
jgi:hypothetical protein